MADELDTELAGVIPELWSREVHRARYSEQISQRVCYTELSDEMKNKGDIIHMLNFPRMTVNDVDATNGDVANQAVTIADTQLTIDQWKEITIEIVDKSGIQSQYSEDELANKFAAEFGPALAENIDNYVFALYGNLTLPAVGSTTDPSIMTDDMIRASLQAMDIARVPKKGRSFILCPKAFWDLFGTDKYVLANMTGLGKGAQITGPDAVPSLYGSKWYESPEIASSGLVSKNLCMVKTAFGLGIQRSPEIVNFAKVRLSKRINGNCLYGAKAFRTGDGIVINTKLS